MSRLHDDFKVAGTFTATSAKLHLSGPIETQDQMDALVEALAIMREWLKPAIAIRQGEDVQQAPSRSDESAGRQASPRSGRPSSDKERE